ncbi:MAG: tyrosine-type recombinase/integrase [Candidatus Kapaibacterium sp.]
MGKRKQIVPGSVFVRNGSKLLYIKYQGKHISTGLDDTPQGRKIAQEMLQQLHFEYINYNQNPVIRTKKIFELFKLFIEEHCKGLEQATIKMYDVSFRSITPADYYISDERINNDIAKFIESYKDKVKVSTITNYLRHYSVFANFLLRKEYISRFPEKLRMERKLSKRGEKPRQVIVFDRTEIEALVQYFMQTDREFALLLMFLWNTGARFQETLKLQWSQVDFKNLKIRFANKINTSEDDYIPMSSASEQVLRELKELKNGTKVFRWSHTSHSRMNKRLNAAMKKLGIEKQDRGFHAIRRTFATNLIESNVSLADVKDLMRHRDIKTTLEHYKAKKSERLRGIVEQSIVFGNSSPNFTQTSPINSEKQG